MSNSNAPTNSLSRAPSQSLTNSFRRFSSQLHDQLSDSDLDGDPVPSGGSETLRAPPSRLLRSSAPQVPVAKAVPTRSGFEATELILKEGKLVSQTVAAIVSTLSTANILNADGSNFASWKRNLREIGTSSLTGPDFFFEETPTTTFEKIGRAVLLASIDRSLHSDTQSVIGVHLMFDSLKRKFQTISRAAQMNVWTRFMAFRLDDSAPLAGIASHLRDLYTEMKSLNARMSSDVFLGFILQSAVASSNAPFASDFESRIEADLQRTGEATCPRFATICHTLNVVRQQHLLNESRASNSPFSPANVHQITGPPTQMVSRVSDDFNVDAFLTGIDETDWCDALDFYAMTASKCWTCGGDNHYRRDCPMRRSKPQAPMGHSKQPIGTLVGTIYGHLPSGLAISTSRFPNHRARAPYSQPSPSQQSAKRFADYYRPRYAAKTRMNEREDTRARPVPATEVNEVILEGLPDDLDNLAFNSMSLGEDLLLQDPVPISRESGRSNFGQIRGT